MPAARAVSTSLAFILRLALAISTVPLIIALIPVPEPPPVTVTTVPPATWLYSSAHAWATVTRVSDPLFLIEVLEAPLAEPPHERRPRAVSERVAVMVIAVFMGGGALVFRLGTFFGGGRG